MNALRYYIAKAKIEYRKLKAVVRKDKYDRWAAELQGILLSEWDDITNEVLENVIGSIRGGQPFSESELGGLIAQIRPYYSDAFTRQVTNPMSEIHTGVFQQGLFDAMNVSSTELRLSDQAAINILQEHNVYWVKNFYDEQLAGKITEFGTQILEQGLTRAEAGQLFMDEFAEKYEAFSWRYWEGFANHVTTRSREMGAISGYERAEIRRVQVRAVMDHRTSDICIHMHDRIIEVEKLSEIKQRILGAQTPDEVKEIAPWPRVEQVEGQTTQSLPGSSLMPPYHFDCRTITVAAPSEVSFYDVSGIDAPTGQDFANRLRNAISNHQQLNPSEMTALAGFMQAATWGGNRIRGQRPSQYAWNKHGSQPDINALSPAEFRATASSLMFGDNKVMYFIKDRNVRPIILFREGRLNVAYDVEDNRIINMWPSTELPEWPLQYVHMQATEAKAGRVQKMLRRLFDGLRN